jgi:hypothetical protein
MVGPLAGANRDPRAPTINVRNVDGGPPGGSSRRCRSAHHQRVEMSTVAPGPHGGFGPYLGSEGCVVHLHGYDRQRVILLMSPATLRLVLL